MGYPGRVVTNIPLVREDLAELIYSAARRFAAPLGRPDKQAGLAAFKRCAARDSNPEPDD
jgi:hypothetical protein